MAAKIVFLPVGNGDMTLLQTEEGKNILIDCNIRDPEKYPDALSMLKGKLAKDNRNRSFVDIFVWTHPDQDHCRGIADYFYLGSPEDWKEGSDKIFINEIWSSPIVYKRASKDHTLCEDAKRLNAEVKRRIELFRKKRGATTGDKVLILGEDEGGRNDDIKEIVLLLDSETNKIGDSDSALFSARLLGPIPKSDLEEQEENLEKNHSSVIMTYRITGGSATARFLTGGDAKVLCWELLHQRLSENGKLDDLQYNVMLSPHHCSWHSLSYESLKDKGSDAKVSDIAKAALGQARDSAIIVSSSDHIADDNNDPPAYRAMQEYQSIIDKKGGQFICMDDHKKDGKNVPLEIVISSDGIKISPVKVLGMSGSGGSAVNRRGGDGYA